MINGNNMVEMREKAAYDRLQSQLSSHSDELLQAYRENEEKQKRIAELEMRVDDAARQHALLQAAREQQEADKQSHLDARLSLEKRNQELERRVRELECASRSARASAACSPAVSRALAASPSIHTLHQRLAALAPEPPAHHATHTPLRGCGGVGSGVGSGEGVGGEGKGAPLAAGVASKAALGLDMQPDSPGEILIRNLDTGMSIYIYI